jgi:hypothetical protein
MPSWTCSGRWSIGSGNSRGSGFTPVEIGLLAPVGVGPTDPKTALVNIPMRANALRIFLTLRIILLHKFIVIMIADLSLAEPLPRGEGQGWGWPLRTHDI